MTMMRTSFSEVFDDQVTRLYVTGSRVPMNYWQSQSVVNRPGMNYSKELTHVQVRYAFSSSMSQLQEDVTPNLPWAEDHFQERVSGAPHNPPPSEAWWPYRVNQNSEHKVDEKFSHTYPERIWSKFAAVGETRPNGRQVFVPHNGIRYAYGDLLDVIDLLERDPLTRQAYLPIWFPEDTGATEGQRVPCTLGYHFLLRPLSDGTLSADIVYHIRSCDLLRHFTDDVYMACRLLQWVVGKLRDRSVIVNDRALKLIMQISSLHVFEGDLPRLKQLADRVYDREEETYGAAI